MLKRFSVALLGVLLFVIFSQSALAQAPRRGVVSPTPSPTPSPPVTMAATPSATVKEDITQPEEEVAREEFIRLFSRREITNLNFFNAGGYIVQSAVRSGVPANTIILILLLPFLATLFAFVRHVVGLPSLEMFVPIALSVTLVSTGFTAGAVLLLAILFGSTIARVILKRVRIMQFPKMALSILVVAVSVFAALTISAELGMLSVKQISIFPILILILIGEKVVSLQLTRSFRETFLVTTVTLFLGLVGFALLSWHVARQAVILYPEVVLLLIPLNVMIGRYFGLRLTEFLRFYTLYRHARK
ncbi:MAG: hypothetical protein NUV69_02105 [Candidatus Curtissbacteria bacterium]|nr:hypothetical protein [Candidatus Curtissbacteria bacterium]